MNESLVNHSAGLLGSCFWMVGCMMRSWEPIGTKPFLDSFAVNQAPRWEVIINIVSNITMNENWGMLRLARALQARKMDSYMEEWCIPWIPTNQATSPIWLLREFSPVGELWGSVYVEQKVSHSMHILKVYKYASTSSIVVINILIVSF